MGKYLDLYNRSIVFSLTVYYSSTVVFTLMYRTTRGAFEQLDKDIVHAAKTLGLSEHKIF